MRCLLFLICLYFSCVFGQNDAFHFTFNDGTKGISGLYVYSFAQDAQGFIWIGTDNGLLRYDGTKFTTYRNKAFQKPLLAEGNIRDIVIDTQQNLWLISETGGLTIFNPKYERFDILRHIPEDPSSLGEDAAYAATVDKTGQIWIAHVSKGLSVYNPKTRKFKRYRNSLTDPCTLSDDFLNNIFIDHTNKIWLATKSKGACYLDPKTQCFVSVDTSGNRLPSNFVNCITEDKAGNMWFGTDEGICCWNRATNKYNTYSKSKFNIADNLSFNARTNADGLLFFSSPKGLTIIDPDIPHFQVYQRDTLLNSKQNVRQNIFVDLFFDKDQNFWLQTHYGFAVSPKFSYQIKPFEKIYNLPNKYSNYFIKQNVAWSYTGEFIIAKNTCNLQEQIFKWPQQQFKQSKPRVMRFLQGSTLSQAIIAGDRNICILDPVKNAWILLPEIDASEKEPLAKFIDYGFLDSKGQLWIVYKQRLYMYTPLKQEWKQWTNENSGCDISEPNYISEFLEDKQGNIWISSFNKYLYRYNPNTQKFKFYKYNNSNPFSVSAKSGLALYQDSKGRLWYAGLGSGIDLYDPNKDRFVHLVKQGDLEDQVYNIGEDISGKLWVFYRSAIVQLSPPDSIDYNQAFHSRFEYMKYDDPQFIKGMEHADKYLLQDCKGFFYFPNSSDKYLLDPASFSPNSNTASMHLTELRCLGQTVKVGDSLQILHKSISYTDTIRLTHNQSSFSLDFSLLNYNDFKTYEYAYKLEGLEKQWHVLNAASASATYTKIPPGNYVLLIEARNSSGLNVLAKRQLAVIVHAAFWQTWWFRFLLMAIVVLVLYGLYRMRINRLEAQQRLRNNIARDLHDEIGSTLSSIAIMSEVVAHSVDKNTDGAKVNLLKIAENARHTLENMDDIIWAINPQNDAFINLEDRLKAYLIPLCESKNITFQLDIDPALDAINVDMQKRRNIYLILKEAINNAIKYSEGTQIIFKCLVVNQFLMASIQDNGKGFDISIPTNRSGIKNMKLRAVELKGRLDINSIINGGTQIILEVPIR